MQPDGAGAGCRVSQCSLGSHSIGRIDEHGHTSGPGHQLAQEFQPLCRQLDAKKIDSCQVAARPGEAGDKTKADRVFGDKEDDRGSSWLPPWPPAPKECSGRDNRGDWTANQFGR